MPLSLDGLDGSTPPKRQKDTAEDKEGDRARWEGPAVTFHLQCLTPPPEEILRLSKRLLIRPRVAGEGLESTYKIILGMLSWQFSLMSQFDGMNEAGVAVTCENCENCGDLRSSSTVTIQKLQFVINYKKCLYFVVQDLKLHRENISTRRERSRYLS